MSSKIKPCPLGKRHKWNFRKNVIRKTINYSTITLSSVGLYQCECGARKYGEYRYEAEQS